MILKTLLLLILVIVSLIAVMVLPIWHFARRDDRKSRRKGCMPAVFFLSIALFAGGYLTYLGVNKIRQLDISYLNAQKRYRIKIQDVEPVAWLS